MAVQPSVGGGEQWLQLRSPLAPEQFRLSFSGGRGLRLSKGIDGSVTVFAGSKGLVSILAPAATDALGHVVPSSYALSGSTLVLRVQHRQSQGVAYPVAVDPIYAQNSCDIANIQDPYNYLDQEYCGTGSSAAPTGNPEAWSKWQFYSSSPSMGGVVNNGGYGAGVYVYGQPGTNYPSGSWGEWVYPAPPGAFIQRADFATTRHTNWWGTSSYMYEGIVDTRNYTWQPETVSDSATGFQQTYLGASPYYYGPTRYPNTSALWVGNSPVPQAPGQPGGSSVNGAPGNAAAFGLQIGAPGTRDWSSLDLSFMNGATVWLYDLTPPSMTSAVPPSSSQWTNDGNRTYSVSPSGYDNGLGMKYFNLLVAHGSVLTSFQTAQNPCAGDHVGGYCPASWTTNFQYQLPEGSDTVAVQPFDATLTGGAGQSWTANIDRTPPPAPTISGLTNGQAVQQGGQTLTINNPDPPANGADASSGPASVSIQVDGGTVTSQACTGQCTWTVPADIAEGSHTVSVTATDGAGNTGPATSLSFVVDRTEPSVDLSGSAWDVHDGTPLATNSVDVQVDATDDNDAGTATSGVTAVEVLVDGSDPNPSGNLYSQSCPNGGCTLSHDFQLNLPNGDHQLEVDVTDAAGNVSRSTWYVQVDSTYTPPSCSTPNAPGNTCTFDPPSMTPPSCTIGAGPNNPPQDFTAAEQNLQRFYPQASQPAGSVVEENQTVAPALAGDAVLSALQTLAPTRFAQGFPGFAVGSGSSSVCLTPQAISSSASQGKLENGAAMLYPATATSTDTLERATPLGVQTVQMLRDGNAPTSFTWNLAIPPGDRIQQLSDGELAVIDPSLPTISSGPPPPGVVDPTGSPPPPDPTAQPGAPDKTIDPESWTASDIAGSPPSASLEQDPTATDNQYLNEDVARQAVDRETDGQAIAFIMPPWAHDANGQTVPTSLSSDGSGTATMSADTSPTNPSYPQGGYSYPITVSHTTVSTANAAGTRNHTQFGITDSAPDFLGATKLFGDFRKSTRFGGHLSFVRTGIQASACDNYDGANGQPVPPGTNLANIDLSKLSGQQLIDASNCKQAALVVQRATDPAQGGFAADVQVAVTEDSNATTHQFPSSYATPAACQRPYIRGVGNPHDAPNPNFWPHYRCSILGLWRTPPFDRVKNWVAFNEPDLVGGLKPFLVSPPTDNKDKTQQAAFDNARGVDAAQTWRIMQALAVRPRSPSDRTPLCPGSPRPGSKNCTIVAGELSGYRKDFLSGYIKGLGKGRPKVWGLHPYNDVVYDQHGLGTRHYEQDLYNKYSSSGSLPEIWLNEAGVALANFGSDTYLRGNNDAQMRAARRFWKYLPTVHLTGRPGRRTSWRPVTRIYYYNWSTRNIFDSALLSTNDPNSQPRRAYCELAVPHVGTTCTTNGQ